MTPIIARHVDPATLLSFSAGALPEPLAAVVAAHIDLCPACGAQAADLDLVGGILLSRSSREGPVPTCPAFPLREERSKARSITTVGSPGTDRLPRSIARAFGLSYDTIPWRRLGPGIWHHRLPLSSGVKGDLRLLRIAAGRVMPEHGHDGAELTLVLEGTYTDATGAYGRGDIQDADETIEHAPVADAEHGCVCLIASERPARFNSVIARLLQPWTGM